MERLGLRATHLRKYSGELWTIPNGQITIFGNATRDYMRAIVDVPLSYRADLDRALAVMRGVAEEWAAEHGGDVLAPPEVHAAHQFGSARLTLRLAVMVRAGAQGAAERELRWRLRRALEREGVGSPFGQGRGEPPPDEG